MTTFSERMGYAEPMSPQTDSLNRRLKNRLWNAVETYLGDLWESGSTLAEASKNRQIESYIRKSTWTDFLAWPVYQYPDNLAGLGGHEVRRRAMHAIREWYFHKDQSWFLLYDFIEYIARFHFGGDIYNAFDSDLNRCLTEEHSAYRFSNDIFTAITNKLELKSVADAATHPEPAMESINKLMKKATANFSKRPKPDYGNAIKDALSALESLNKHVGGIPTQTFTPALERATKELELPEEIREGFRHLYKYACDNANIRHGNLDVAQATEEEARYMLVTISAAVNFIADKARHLGKL